ncbi:hypothetical protein F442_07198 [Phytophthora nicotianae P10297]|uniref:Uncharacterized protein n=1 Tax=Phytophthora nicotianae P10297 TaxID=1317064 RepID=W2ZHX6_PHYNI|nr:hypothetical protein F442_07198 [Phytophthora nicotianae P10297]
MRYADNLSLSAWRAIAVLQKEKRLEAEQNHKQQRSAVVERARVIHQMKMLLQRFKADEGKNESRVDGDQRFLFKALVGELDAIYARTHQIIREANFKMSPKLPYKPMRKVNQGVEYFDNTDASGLPFDFNDTSCAMSLLMTTDPSMIRNKCLSQETFLGEYIQELLIHLSIL